MRSAKSLALITAAAAIVALAGCAPSGGAAEDGTITIGTLRGQPHLFTPYFYDEVAAGGQEYEIVVFDSSGDIKNAIVSGSVDFGVLGAAAVISGVAQQQDVRIVASAADGGTRIVASDGIETAQDLVGKKVGFPLGATQEILLKRTLEAEGIDPAEDVELVNLPFAEMAGAYESGQIDAFISAEVGPSIAMQGGAHELLSAYDTAIGQTNIVLATSNSNIDDDAELVQGVVDTHIAATEYMIANPDEWAADLVEEFSLDSAVIATAIENTWPRSELDADYLATLEAMSTEMLEFDQLGTEADQSLLTDVTFVEASI